MNFPDLFCPDSGLSEGIYLSLTPAWETHPALYSKAANRNRNRVNRTMRTGTGSEPEPVMNWTGGEPEPECIFLNRNRHEPEPDLFFDPLLCFEPINAIFLKQLMRNV